MLIMQLSLQNTIDGSDTATEVWAEEGRETLKAKPTLKMACVRTGLVEYDDSDQK